MCSVLCKDILSLSQDSWNNTLSKYIFNIYNGPVDHCPVFILYLVVETNYNFYILPVERLSKFNWILPFPKIKLFFLRAFVLS